MVSNSMAIKASAIAKSLKKDDIVGEIITVLNENKGVSGDGIAGYCVKFKMNDRDTLNVLTEILSGLLYRDAAVRDDDYDADELRAGIKEEKEHASIKKIQEIIAKDHLHEVPDYYTEIKKAGIR